MFLQVLYERERLQSLSKTHFVTENSRQTLLQSALILVNMGTAYISMKVNHE
jgi:hypothetical protein